MTKIKNETVGLKLENENGVYIEGENVDGVKFYKDPEAFVTGKGICYISSNDIDKLKKLYEITDNFISEDALLSLGIGCSREMIFTSVAEMLDSGIDACGSDLTRYLCFVSEIAECVFENLSGEGVITHKSNGFEK